MAEKDIVRGIFDASCMLMTKVVKRKGRGGSWRVEAWVWFDGEGMTSLHGFWRVFLIRGLKWRLIWFSL